MAIPQSSSAHSANSARDARLKIGRLAQETGTSVETIRYYERIGLLARAPRTGGGFRLYGPDDVHRLRFVRRARELGFSLVAVRELIGLADDPVRPCDEVDAMARAHLSDVNERIAQLTALRGELSRLIRVCQGGNISDCRILEALGHSALT